MKKALIGAGGFAEEVRAHMGQKIKCFVDDDFFVSNANEVFPLSEFDPYEYQVLVAIGDSQTRKKIVNRLPIETKYFTFVHPSAQILSNDFQIGKGSIICAGSIITTNCILGEHTHLNLQTTIGHDCRIGDFFTTAPGAKISGNCKIGNCVYLGTNVSIKQKIEICDEVIVGLNSGVVRNITEKGTYVGIPAKKLEK